MPLDIVSRGALVFTIFIGLVGIISSIRSLLYKLKIRKRIAFLRANPDEVPLYREQPFHLALMPPALLQKITWKGHLVFFVIWVGIVVVIEGIGLLLAQIISPLFWSDALLVAAILSSCWGGLMLILHVVITLMLYQRIEASETELIVRRGLVCRRISWDQARLFAVDCKMDEKSKITSYWDELSGRQKVVRWEYYAEIPPRTFLKFSPAEYPQELAYLRSYIHAKTDLPLRDLQPFRK